MATPGVMLSKGQQASRCTQKVEHTQNGLWPRQQSCYLRGHRQASAHTRRNTQKAFCGHCRSHVNSGGTGKHTQGGTYKRRSVASPGVMLLQGPQARWCTHKDKNTKSSLLPAQGSCWLRGHRQGGADTRQNTQKAVCGYRSSQVIYGATGKVVHSQRGSETIRWTDKGAREWSPALCKASQG